MKQALNHHLSCPFADVSEVCLYAVSKFPFSFFTNPIDSYKLIAGTLSKSTSNIISLGSFSRNAIASSCLPYPFPRYSFLTKISNGSFSAKQCVTSMYPVTIPFSTATKILKRSVALITFSPVQSLYFLNYVCTSHI